MLISVLLSVFVYLATFVVAAPTPGAVSKRSSKRENFGINFQRDLLEESKKREEHHTNVVAYVGLARGGPFEDQKRELQGDDFDYDDDEKKREPQGDDFDYDDDEKKHELQGDDLDDNDDEKKREL